MMLLVFFAPVKNPKLKTGSEVKAREAKEINQLKEDKQVFGLLVAKEISPEEVYSYPLPTLPFALSDPSGKLQQSQKAPLRNYLVSESKSTRKEVPRDANWIYDGMAVVRAIPIKSTWKELADTFLEAVTPQENLHPASIQIPMDTYDDNQTKEMTQGVFQVGESLYRTKDKLCRKIRMIGIIFLIMVRTKPN